MTLSSTIKIDIPSIRPARELELAVEVTRKGLMFSSVAEDSVIPMGIEKEKVDPCPSVLSTLISPFIISTSCFEIASPRPVPASCFSVGPS